MLHVNRVSLIVGVAIVTLTTISGDRVYAQDVDPNAAPNPYREDVGWAKLPAGRKWGAAIGVDIDRDGKSVWVFDRCATADDCSGSNLAPIQKFDPSGKLVLSFGAGMFNYPHGLYVDRDNNIWVSDGRAKNNGKGHTVMKFSPDGKLLMTLGKPGVAGDGPDTFNAPSDVLVAPNGDIFVADGHGGETNARIVKFAKEGKFIKTWGKKGEGAGRVRRAARARDGFRRTAVRRRPRQQPHPDFRPGRKIPRRVAAIRPAERRLHRQERHPLRRRLALEREAIRRSIPASSRASASAASRTARSRPSFRERSRARWKASRPTTGQCLWRLHQHAELPPVCEEKQMPPHIAHRK